MDKQIFIPILEIGDKMPRLRKIAEAIDRESEIGIAPIVYGSGDWTEELREKVPENFCLYPFTHFQLDPDGRARPCCKYKVGDDTWQADVPKLPQVNIGQLWEQEEFQNLRRQFLNNERPSGCKACWDEEAAGIRSMRLVRERGGKEHPFATFFIHIPRPYPKSLDLKLSNLCNLKCRICTPFLSTQWINEIKALNIHDMGTVESFSRNSREKFLADPQNEIILTKWAKTIEYVEFYGGEPLLQQEHDKIINIIYQRGIPSNTGLYYNTNTTICKEELFKLWKPFREVCINFSIDDIKERFEYQRANANWEQSLANIRMYQELSRKYSVNMKIRLYVTVGILNVWYIKEFIEYVEHLNIPVTFNMVHYPHHYSITNLPEEVKDIVKKKLLSINFKNVLDPHSPTATNIINFMYGTKTDSNQLKTFFLKTRIHDEYRKESFNNTFPELFGILKKYET